MRYLALLLLTISMNADAGGKLLGRSVSSSTAAARASSANAGNVEPGRPEERKVSKRGRVLTELADSLEDKIRSGKGNGVKDEMRLLELRARARDAQR